MMGGDLDWKIETVPQKHLNDRILPLCRGKLLGGSSAFNGTVCIRGHKKDYDEWDLPGWTGDEMFAYMKKVSGPLLGLKYVHVTDACSPKHSMESLGSMQRSQSMGLTGLCTFSRKNQHLLETCC